MKRVTVLCPTYNHEKYIADTLDGFVKQETDFEFEVIVADDASLDNTPEIIRQYAQKYPDLIKPVLRKKNLGAVLNFQNIIKNIDTEYVAICEGDDFWTDAKKLQTQFDFMEKNKDFSMCYHPVEVVFEMNGKKKHNKKEINPSLDYDSPFFISEFSKNPYMDPVLTLEDVAKKASIPCCSVFYRWRFRGGKDLELFRTDIEPRDFLNNLLHAEIGKVYFINKVMGVYRRPDVSYWSVKNIYHDHFFNILNFYKFSASYFSEKINSVVMKSERDSYLKSGLDYFKENKDKESLLKYISEYTDFFFRAEEIVNKERNVQLMGYPLFRDINVNLRRTKRYLIRIFWLVLFLLFVNILFYCVLIW